MGVYSIKDLENLSGIKAHTIRMWEQRYDLIEPHRTDTNIRYYDDEQLKYLLNVSLLIKKGFKISRVSKLPKEELNRLLIENYDVTTEEPQMDDKVKDLLVAMIELDEQKFDKVFASSVVRIGFEQTFLKLIYPFLQKVGIMWGVDEINPAQEHFISNLIRQKLFSAIDGLSNIDYRGDKYLLFLPEGELHELGLLLSSYLIKSRSKPVIYLGQNVPFNDLKKVYDQFKPKYLLTFFITSTPETQVSKYLNDLSKAFPDSTILISGSVELLESIKPPDSVVLLKKVEDLLAILN